MDPADEIKKALLQAKQAFFAGTISREEYQQEKVELEAMLKDIGVAPPATTPPTPAVRASGPLSHGATISGTGTQAPAVMKAGGDPAAGGTSLEPGSTFAERYAIEARLGEGGMGVTYRAKDTLLDRMVCLKVIRPALVADEGIARRFLNEARVGISLTHENFVRVHDAGRSAGLLYLSMEYVEGTPMRQWLNDLARKGAVAPIEHVVEVARQILLPLCEAHSKKVVHRDLKPENVILVGKPGEGGFRVEILDFGIAKVLEGPMLTVDGARMGTSGYMAPEQATRAETAGPEADVYAIGAMVYEMLTGVLPLGMVQEPRAACEDCPQWLSQAVMRALSFPQRRFPSAKEFLEALGEAKPARGGVPAVSAPHPHPPALATADRAPKVPRTTSSPPPRTVSEVLAREKGLREACRRMREAGRDLPSNLVSEWLSLRTPDPSERTDGGSGSFDDDLRALCEWDIATGREKLLTHRKGIVVAVVPESRRGVETRNACVFLHHCGKSWKITSWL